MPTILIADEELHLILRRIADRLVRVERAPYRTERIARAKLIELPGEYNLFCTGNADTVTDGFEEVLAGVRRTVDADRVLATVLFADVVGSTEVAPPPRRRQMARSPGAVLRRGPARARPIPRP